MTSSPPAHYESCGCFAASDGRADPPAQLCLPCYASSLPQLFCRGLLMQGNSKLDTDLLLILPTQSRVKHSLAVNLACEITFTALINFFKQNQIFSFLWGVITSENHLKASKPHEGMCLMYKHTDINRQSYMPSLLAAFLWDCIQNVTGFVKESWLHFAETSFFSVMKWQSLRLWHSRALNHFSNLKYLCSAEP